MVGSVIRPLRRFSNNNLNREVRWDIEGDTPASFSRERAEPSALADAGHRFYDKLRRHSDGARHDTEVWGRRSAESTGEAGQPAHHDDGRDEPVSDPVDRRPPAHV